MSVRQVFSAIILLHIVFNFENNGTEDGSARMDTPTDLMTLEQRSEYSRLVIEIAATKTEISTIRERIRGNTDSVSVRVGFFRNIHIQVHRFWTMF